MMKIVFGSITILGLVVGSVVFVRYKSLEKRYVDALDRIEF